MAFSSILYLWNKWNIRGFVILSLLLQVFLILFAPLRKKTTNNRIVFLLWLAYLMADWVAAFGIGLISHNQGSSSAHIADVDKALRVFWASFLLVHLGGPDTITAFSLEDSSLWRRHLLSLIFQVVAVIYVFVQIFPSDKSPVFPTMLVFLAGVIKNVERTLALNLSSLPRLREWVLSQQEYHDDDEVDKSRAELLDDVVKKTKGALNLSDGNSHDEEEAKLAESIVVKHAYYFFQISKLFLTDLIFTCRQRAISQEYFRRVSAMDALRVLSVELHFIYEVLHTKAVAIRSKWSYVFRFIAFIGVATAFVVFNRLKKYQLLELDVKITYLLLFGGIALDVIAVLMLVFSDWTVAEIQWYKTGSSKLDSFLHNLVSATDYVTKPQFPTCEAELNTKVTYAALDTPLIFRRWSESISACNLFSELLEKSPRKMYKRHWRWGNIAFSKICGFPFYMAEKAISCFRRAVDPIARGFGMGNKNGERRMIANMRYVSTNPFIMKLWIFIFKEVRRKFNYAIHSENLSVEIERRRKVYEARGDWFLETLQCEARHRSHGDSDTESVHEARDDENPRTIPGDKEREIMRDSIIGASYDESIITWHLATEMWYNREDPVAGNDEREFSKILSDYMMYLLLNQPNVVSAVAGIAQMRSAAMVTLLRMLRDRFHAEDVKSLCEATFAVYAEAVCGPHLEIPLLDRGIMLAQAIGKLGEGKWEATSGVWVEMLTYAAGHIKGEAHAQVLSRGGELLAFVWLLIIHFGLFYRSEWGPYYIYRETEESLGP